MFYQRSQSNENSSIPGSPSSASQGLDDDTYIDILIYGIAVARGALRDLKHTTLDDAGWSSFMEDCDGVNNQVIAHLTKDLAPWYLSFALSTRWHCTDIQRHRLPPHHRSGSYRRFRRICHLRCRAVFSSSSGYSRHPSQCRKRILSTEP